MIAFQTQVWVENCFWLIYSVPLMHICWIPTCLLDVLEWELLLSLFLHFSFHLWEMYWGRRHICHYLNVGSFPEIRFNQVNRLWMHPAESNGVSNSGLNKMRLNVLLVEGRHWSLSRILLAFHCIWLFIPQNGSFSCGHHILIQDRRQAERQKAEGQCYLNKSGPFYQESKLFSRATREAGKAGNRIVGKDLD